jgi:hypothetical protein
LKLVRGAIMVDEKTSLMLSHGYIENEFGAELAEQAAKELLRERWENVTPENYRCRNARLG